MPLVGATMNDSYVAGFVMGAVWLALPIEAETGVRLISRRMILGGFLIGVAAGSKLTAVPYAVGLVVAIVAVQPSIQHVKAVGIVFVAACAFGFALTAAPWMLFLHYTFQNPLVQWLFPITVLGATQPTRHKAVPQNLLDRADTPVPASTRDTWRLSRRITDSGWTAGCGRDRLRRRPLCGGITNVARQRCFAGCTSSLVSEPPSRCTVLRRQLCAVVEGDCVLPVFPTA